MSEKLIVGEAFFRGEWHFLRRLYERYGIVLSRDELITLRNDILNNKYKPRVSGARLGRAEYYVKIKDQPVLLSADACGALVTALPYEAPLRPPRQLVRQSIPEQTRISFVRDGKERFIRRGKGGNLKKANFRLEEARREVNSSRYQYSEEEDEDDD